MLLKPRQTKYRKYHKGRISYNIRTNQDWLGSSNNDNVSNIRFKYGILALEPGRITASNMNAIELAIKRKLKSDGGSEGQKLELRVFPHIPVTKKPIEVRMGKGKGNIDYWMTRVKTGAILLEFNCSNENFGKIISKIVN